MTDKNLWEQSGFSDFGKAFQENLVQIILTDHGFASTISEVLDFNFFEVKYLRYIIQDIFSFREKYKTFPNKETIETIILSKYDNDEPISNQIKDFIGRWSEKNTPNLHPEYVKQNALDFCKKQKLKEAMIKSADLIKSASFEDIKALINNALKLGNSNDFGHQYIEHFEERYSITARNPVSTGWDVLDKYIKGGLAERRVRDFYGWNRIGKIILLNMSFFCCFIFRKKGRILYT